MIPIAKEERIGAHRLHQQHCIVIVTFARLEKRTLRICNAGHNACVINLIAGPGQPREPVPLR